MYEMGIYFKNYFKDKGIIKIFIIESFGIVLFVMIVM